MADLTDLPHRHARYDRGDAEQARPLPSGTWPLLRFLGRIVPADKDSPPVASEEVRLPEVRLAAAARAALAAVVGEQHLSTERLDRVEHAGGDSYPDLYRRRTGDGSLAPDAVVYPGTSQEVAELLAVCLEHEVVVLPFGGAGPARRGAAAIGLDLYRLDAMVAVDPLAQTADVQAGVRVPDVEAALQQYGLSLGEGAIIAATVATPTGEIRLDDRAVAKGGPSGPPLLDVVIGSGGTLGVVTEATVRLARKPRVERLETWAFRDLRQGLAALRDVAQELGQGIAPDLCRLSDANETTTVMSQSGIAGIPSLGVLRARGWREPALAVFRMEGRDQSTLRFRRKKLAAVLKRHGAARMPESIGEHWMRNRVRESGRRDRLMDRGVFVDTIETVTTWDALDRLYVSVQTALTEALGERSWVQCHIGDIDPGGARLTHTVMATGEGDPLAQWERVTTAVRDAAVAVGGVDPAAGRARMLRALRSELDPKGVLGPVQE